MKGEMPMSTMVKTTIRVHGGGEFRDEGGEYSTRQIEIPSWVPRAQRNCGGCHDNFYNGRLNCGNRCWCWSLKPEYARRKTKPPCYH